MKNDSLWFVLQLARPDDSLSIATRLTTDFCNELDDMIDYTQDTEVPRHPAICYYIFTVPGVWYEVPILRDDDKRIVASAGDACLAKLSEDDLESGALPPLLKVGAGLEPYIEFVWEYDLDWYVLPNETPIDQIIQMLHKAILSKEKEELI